MHQSTWSMWKTNLNGAWVSFLTVLCTRHGAECLISVHGPGQETSRWLTLLAVRDMNSFHTVLAHGGWKLYKACCMVNLQQLSWKGPFTVLLGWAVSGLCPAESSAVKSSIIFEWIIVFQITCEGNACILNINLSDCEFWDRNHWTSPYLHDQSWQSY